MFMLLPSRGRLLSRLGLLLMAARETWGSDTMENWGGGLSRVLSERNRGFVLWLGDGHEFQETGACSLWIGCCRKWGYCHGCLRLLQRKGGLAGSSCGLLLSRQP